MSLRIKVCRFCPCFPFANLQSEYSLLLRLDVVSLYNAEMGFPLSLSHVFSKWNGILLDIKRGMSSFVRLVEL